VRETLAAAKVNLFLHVGAPTPDGYHPICSLMVFADIGDRLSLRHAEATTLSVDGPFGHGLGADDDNLVMKATRAMAAEAGIPAFQLAWRLEKNLPVASGLGGGSSDAAAAIRLLHDELEQELDGARLYAIAAWLGSDIAPCLAMRPVLAEGRGQRLSPAPGLPPLDAVLVRPPVPVSTPAVYRRLDELGRFGDVTPPVMPDAFESVQEVAGWLATQRNDLEAPAIAVAPEVGAVLDTLRDEPEALLARVSGSGGACFALCADDIAAETLAERIESIAPTWWVQRCRLGGPW
jgi:4-diphosphocytidyl-2-C-methyl-D-erythritol kinase